MDGSTSGVAASRGRVARAAWALALAALGIVTAAATAHATVMVEIPFERLVGESDAIVHGRVLRTGSRLVANEGEGGYFTPHTLTEIEVYEPLRGSVGERVVIDEIGGTYQGGGMWIEGTPRYRRGEELVVFLRALPDGHFRTHGMAQGHFEVRPGLAGVEPVVLRDTSAIGMASWSHGPMELQPGTVATMPLVAFLDYVRDLAAAGGAR